MLRTAVLIAAALLLSTLAAEAPARDDYAAVRAKAFEHAQMAASSPSAVALAQSAARLGSRDPALAALIRERQEAEGRYAAADAVLAAARGKADPISLDRVKNLGPLVEQERAQLDALDARLRRDYPAFAELISPAPLPLQDTQALLGPDEALLLILPTPRGVQLFALRHDRIEWARGEATEAEVERLTERLRVAVDPVGAVRAAQDASGGAARDSEPAGFPRAEAYRLYGSVWAPVAGTIGDAETVYVVAGGALGSLPLSLLVTAPPRGSDLDPSSLRATPWLIKRHALSSLPSVSSLKALRSAAPRAAHEGFAGYGDPVLGDPAAAGALNPARYVRGSAADVAALKSLPSLPGTRRELGAMARAFRAPASAVKTGPAATERAVRGDDLSGVSVVAFATHGLLGGEFAGLAEPALVLTPPEQPSEADDGLLTASEAANLKLSADWVVLSACNTAEGGERLSGLTRAFFYAGAKAVLASHWRVRDDAAARLTADALTLYARKPEMGRAQALRRAALKLMADRSDPFFASPAAWAPFVVIGDGR
jgi:CHAT domain-containing protein